MTLNYTTIFKMSNNFPRSQQQSPQPAGCINRRIQPRTVCLYIPSVQSNALLWYFLQGLFARILCLPRRSDDRTGVNLRLNGYFFSALINKTAAKERGIILASIHAGNI